MQEDLKAFYRDQLLERCLPFWLRHARDREFGGYHTCLNRDGSVYEHDKLCMWSHGRIIWTFSYLYNELEPNAEWLEMARWGVDFLQKYGFTPDGRMYYSLTRDGRPLEPGQDVYTELSTVIGFSEFARATSDEALYDWARQIFAHVWERLKEPGRAFQPYALEERPVRMHGHSMITLNTLQELRRFHEDSAYEEMIDDCLGKMLGMHLRPERRALLEMVSWDGKDLPGSRGRWICPGHMMEGGIFLIHEGQRRADPGLIENGVNLIDWGFERGWDEEFGGIFNDVDAEGLPVPTVDALLYDTKLWWQHAEALYALLLARAVTGDERFLAAHDRVRDYCVRHFVDAEQGEWYAALDRTGRRINDAKGTSRKNPFHLARNTFHAWRLLDRADRS